MSENITTVLIVSVLTVDGKLLEFTQWKITGAEATSRVFLSNSCIRNS